MNKKKKIIFCVIGIVLLAAIAVVASSLLKEDKQSDTNPETTVEETTTEVVKKPKSFLTGEDISAKKANRRPVALMYNNIINAIPHSGISNASILYEAPVEGAITRIMGIFENYDKLEKMGSVRSCRIYYCSFALEWDAIYAHYGQSKYALDFLKSDKIDNVSSFNADRYFYRTTDRVAPHNCFTSGEQLNEAIKSLNYRKKYNKDYTGHFNFAEKDNMFEIEKGRKANKVEIGYQINEPYYIYNNEDGQYYRYQYGEKHIDDQNNEQISCKNIIIQFVDSTYYPDNKSLDITLKGNGTGWYITNGKAEKITWSKENQRSGQTKYFDKDGNEITLNVGKTNICIVQNNYSDRVKISK